MLPRPCIARITEDLLRSEIARARAGDVSLLPPGPWPDEMPIDVGGLGADSLEVYTLAGALAEQFHIHESGLEDWLLSRVTFGDWVDLVEQSRAMAGTRISFRTSGSTGKPRRCTHLMSDLVVEAAGHARRLQPRRVLSAVPAHHIYGLLFTILLPLQAGCEVVDIRRTLPGDDAFRPGDVIISFPQHWQFLLRSMQTLPAVCGVSSTATLPADLAAALRDGGLVRLVEIYGSSETSGIAWRDATEGAFALLDGLRVVAAPEGPGVLRLARADGRELVTPDLVEMAGPAAFYVRGRADGAVQVGGLNVYPAQVAQMLEQHPLVARARVRLAADAAGGRLKALVVPKPECGSTETLRADLERWILARLPPAERPRSVTFAGTLPVGALGKECDWMETP